MNLYDYVQHIRETGNRLIAIADDFVALNRLEPRMSAQEFASVVADMKAEAAHVADFLPTLLQEEVEKPDNPTRPPLEVKQPPVIEPQEPIEEAKG